MTDKSDTREGVVTVRWTEFEAAQPKLARLGRDRLIRPGVVLVGTTRRDGTPRISPVEPLLLAGDLWLGMLWGSHKAADLVRDPRVLVHNIVTSPDGGVDGEFKLRGRGRDQPDVQPRYAEAAAEQLGWRPVVGRFHLFSVDIASVAYLAYDHQTGDQHVVLWPPGEEFVRRGTSPTSLGPPEPVRDLLS
jgi:hypothetical protein